LIRIDEEIFINKNRVRTPSRAAVRKDVSPEKYSGSVKTRNDGRPPRIRPRRMRAASRRAAGSRRKLPDGERT